MNVVILSILERFVGHNTMGLIGWLKQKDKAEVETEIKIEIEIEIEEIETEKKT